MRRLLGLLLIVLLLVGFPQTVQGQSAQGSNLTLNRCFYYAKQDAQSSAGTQILAKCGTLNVPEDWSQPQGKTIKLHFDIILPLDPAAAGLPIFHLEGGPGGAAISSFGRLWYTAYLPLLQDHPIVLVDQRGTGTSAPLYCSEITDPVLKDLTLPVKPADDSAAVATRLKQCRQRLETRSNPEAYTSNAAADDLDAVRQALGYDQIEIFSNSYGTSLAQIYLKRHGDNVAGVVLDSVVAPWDNWLLDANNNGQQALTNIFATCKADSVCSKKYTDPAGQLTKVLKNLKNRPATISVTVGTSNTLHKVVITPQRYELFLFRALYNDADIADLLEMISKSAQGDYSIVARGLVNLQIESRGGDSGLYFSVICSELIPFYTDSLLKQYATTTYFADTETAQDYQNYCKSWPGATLTPEDVAPVASDRPVLILSGNLDPITPVKFGNEAHARLSNSTLAVFPFQTHGVFPSSLCAQKLVVAFFTTPTDTVDTTCTAQDIKPVFAGTYSLTLVAFNDKTATFSGRVPKGWTKAQDNPLTFFTSPDGLQTYAAAVYKNQFLDDVQADVLKHLQSRFSSAAIVDHYEQDSVRVVQVDLPQRYSTGLLVLIQGVANVKVVWLSVPNAWSPAAFEYLASKALNLIN